MNPAAILQPAVALMAWTMVMWLWMYATRIPAMNAAKLDPDALAQDPTRTLDDILPAQVQWKAHNYNHLHEAPTLFYAVCLVLAVAGQGNGCVGLCGPARDPLLGASNREQGCGALCPVCAVLDCADGADLPRCARGVLNNQSRTNRLASSTWVDQRNWPTGRTSASL